MNDIEMQEEQVVTEATDPRDLKIQQLEASLNAERAERKKLKKQIADTNLEDESELARLKDQYREMLRNGKSSMSDDVIDDLMDAFGNKQAEMQVKNSRQSIEREIMELKRKPEYIDADDYGVDIRNLMKKGLTAEQAYWAVAGNNKFNSSIQLKEDELNKTAIRMANKDRASQGFVNANQVAGQQDVQYTERERSIANALHKSEEEVKARTGGLTITQILEANKKFKK